MRVAISASEPTLDADVDPRFGRCRYFIIIDPEDMEFEAVENSGAMAGSGAGIATAQMIADRGAEVVLTGNCGPKAFQVLSATGIKVITGVSGKVQDALMSYKSGQLLASSQPSVAGHFGLGHSTGKGKGMAKRVMPSVSPATQPTSSSQGIEALKAQSRALTQKLTDIQGRIEELKKRQHQQG